MNKIIIKKKNLEKNDCEFKNVWDISFVNHNLNEENYVLNDYNIYYIINNDYL